MVITDYAMPGDDLYGDGIRLVKYLIRHYPGVRVVVLTMVCLLYTSPRPFTARWRPALRILALAALPLVLALSLIHIWLMNYVVPLQIGARDVAFPFLNNFSFWMTTGGVVLVMMSLFVGEFARTGWLAYPPLSGIAQSPDVGVDYYIWALQIAGVGTLLSGVNLLRCV